MLVDEEVYLLELSRYIVFKPGKANRVNHAGDWKWSSYQAMAGISVAPEWLATEYILSQFSKQRKTAIRKYSEFVQAGMNMGPIWTQLNNQIYLGDSSFIDKVQIHLEEKETDIQIPKVQKRAMPRSLSYYKKHKHNRNEAIVAAYLSGGYSYQQIGEYFGLHFTMVGRIIRESK